MKSVAAIITAPTDSPALYTDFMSAPRGGIIRDEVEFRCRISWLARHPPRRWYDSRHEKPSVLGAAFGHRRGRLGVVDPARADAHPSFTLPRGRARRSVTRLWGGHDLLANG